MRTQSIKHTKASASNEKAKTTTAATSILHKTLTKMRRVSSRQRLVSWDAFEASSLNLSIETYYEPSTPPRISPSSISSSSSSSSISSMLSEEKLQQYLSSRNNNRKRNRVERSVNSMFGFDSILCQDVQLHIASFLTVTDARALMLTNKNYYDLVQDATFLWEQWCHQQWPHLPADVEFSDSSTSFSATKTPNYSQLLRLAATNQPTLVDSSSFVLRRTPLFRSIERSTPNTVQYLGVVGTGDRCIRSNAPLVRPKEDEEEENKATMKHNLFKFLLHRKSQSPKPFVSPFCHEGNKIILTPRLVSYFEISILAQGPDVAHDLTTIIPAQPANVSDCVAIGLSTKSFRCFSRMPGWDAFSYGYHGDDGGIFHSSGDMLKRFGPSFGKGDTIGCGVSYRNGGIFFTLNGKFLGFAWENLDGLSRKDLYPTVGVDSNAPVDCNFGDKPFHFDLCDFLKKERAEEPAKR